jgi:hypothetical protein
LFFPERERLEAEDLAKDLFCVRIWQPIVSWSLRQIEESFCDFIGTRLFGESYLKAFAYLLSPAPAGPRTFAYPSLETRVANLCRAAREMGIETSADYESMFSTQANPHLSREEIFRLELADSATEDMIETAMQLADQVATEAKIAKPSPEEAKRILSRFHKVVPAEKCTSLTAILNAAWIAYEDASLWSIIGPVRKNRERVLSELVLKNIEVFEIEQRGEAAS